MITSIDKTELIEIGQFNRTHGIKGEISFSMQKADLFEETNPEYVVCLMDGLPVPFYIEDYFFKSDTGGYMTIRDINSEEKARMFVNLPIFLHKVLVKEDRKEELSVEDLVGYTLRDQANNKIGIITLVDTSTLNTLFLIERNGKEFYIPYSDDFFLSINEQERTLYLDLPDGLLSLDDDI